MKKLLILTLSIFFFIYNEMVEARMSNYFPISNESGKMEFAYSFATNGSNYLVPVMVESGSTWSLYAQFVSNNGTLGNRIPIRENSTKYIYSAKVAYGGGKYLVTGVVRGNDTTDIKGIFIYPDGRKGDIFTIASISSSVDGDPNVAYGGGKFLVAYENRYSYSGRTYKAIFGKFVDSNGTISNEFKISEGDGWTGFSGGFNQIAFNGTNFLVVYSKDDTKVLARYVSPSYGPLDSELVIDDSNNPSDNPHAIFFDGEKYLIVWTDQTQSFPSVWHFYGKFLYPNGTQTQPFQITSVNSWKVVPSIAFDGAKYLITWNDSRYCGFDPINESLSCIRTGLDIYGRYFSKKGVPLGGEFVVSQLNGSEVGGIMVRTLNGKALGIINKNLEFRFEQEPITEDVYGRFWVSSGYDIFAPDNKEKVMAGSNYTIRWNAPANAVKFDIYYSNDNGATWKSIKTGHTLRALNWSVPAQDGRKPNCKIKIVAYDSSNNTLTTFYSRPFSIEVAKIIQPNGGELLTSGQTYTIKWQTQGLNKTVSTVTLQYSFDGNTWKNIKTLTGNPGQTTLTVPTVNEYKPTTLIRLIFKDADGNTIAITESEAVFTVSPPLS